MKRSYLVDGEEHRALRSRSPFSQYFNEVFLGNLARFVILDNMYESTIFYFRKYFRTFEGTFEK